MSTNFSKPKIKRKLRAKRKQFVALGESANKHIDRHIFRRWNNLQYAKRFIAGWVALMILLIFGVVFQTTALGKHYLEPSPIAGGIYTEGIEGNFSNANPIYASSGVDAAVSKIIFSSLLTYDDTGKLKGDLAESWNASSNGRVYSVKLKPNIKWHDGKNLTADDVVYTYATIQNADAKSPLYSGWKGVKVEKINDQNVKFTLPTPYAPFPNLLTNGILPKHILGQDDPASLRSASFNTQGTVGSGPFKLVSSDSNSNSDKQVIQLTSNKDYYLGPPGLDGITIKTYKDAKSLSNALDKKEVVGAGGLNVKDYQIKSPNSYSFTQNSATMLFMKNSAPVLADAKVRQALTHSTQVMDITKQLGYDATPVREPLLVGQTGYNKDFWQYGYNKQEADKLFNEAGWLRVDGKKYRQKNGQDLSLKLVSENNSIYPSLATELQKQWAEAGVRLDVSFVTPDQITQTYIPNHEYDIFLYGINIGPDPDVYAYWHSSQADTGTARLNLSEYKSTTANIALESARSRSDPALRAAKYKPFLEAWKKDAPAIGLYQPRYLYLTNQPVYNLHTEPNLNSPEDRFNNVHEWMINTAKVQKQ